MPEGMQTGAPSPELVWNTINGFVRTSALRAAVELDLFTAVGEGHTDVPALARRCNASERGIRALANYLVTIELLGKTDGRYHHTPTSAAFLDRNSPACLAETTRFLSHAYVMGAYDNLAAVVRNGRTALPGQGTVEENHKIWVEFARGMAPMMKPMAAPLGQIVLNGARGLMRVLDIAAGHGLFGIEIAKQNPKATVVALDWEAVLEVARENAEEAGVADRFQTINGSAFDVDFGGPYDAILLTNFLHHFDPETCVKLLKKVRASLAPGGKAATLEFIPNDDRVTPAIPAAFSLMMLATTANGDAYTYRELDQMHREAGFTRTTIHPVPKSPHQIVLGYQE